MATTEEARLVIRGENQTEAAFRQIKSSMADLDSSASKLKATFAQLGIGLSIVATMREIAQAVLQAEASEARLTATLRATGNAVGFTSEQLEAMNAQLVQASTFDDEGIRNAQAQLVKFGNVSGDVFRRALTLSADYAALLGTELPDAAQQLGRALSAPSVGLTFLERNVGHFGAATQEAIKKLVDLGDTAGAQRLILDELDKRIGGTAETMNSGLTKATSDLKKSWEELLETLGRTKAADDAATSIGFLAQSAKDLKEIMTNGDWVEKTLAFFAFAGGFRGFKLTPQQIEGPTVTGKVTGTPPTLAQVAQGGMTDETLTDAVLQNVDKNLKKVTDDMRAAADAQAALFNDTFTKNARDAAEELEHVRETLEKMRKAGEDAAAAIDEPFVQAAEAVKEYDDSLVYTYDENGKRITMTREKFDALTDATKKGSDAARDLGLTFASAFEDAILQAKSLQDVLRGLAQDILRIIVRKTVTEPIANAIIGVLGGIVGGGAAPSSGKASGGPVSAGMAYLVGEQGPELFLPRISGSIVPTPGLTSLGGGMTINQVMNFAASTPAAAREAVFAMLPQITQATKAAIIDAKTRGALPGFA